LPQAGTTQTATRRAANILLGAAGSVNRSTLSQKASPSDAIVRWQLSAITCHNSLLYDTTLFHAVTGETKIRVVKIRE